MAWEGGTCYLPIRHPDSENFSQGTIVSWLKALFSSNKFFVFHNAPYDLGWLRVAWDIKPPINIEDTAAAAVMLDENRFSYRLDDVCKWRGVVGKDETTLQEIAAAYKFKNIKHELYQLPAKFVGPYAEADARATLALFKNMKPDLEREGVFNAYRTETNLIPLCLEMRRRGIKIDENAAEQAKILLEGKRDECLQTLSSHYGQCIGLDTIRQTKWLEEAHDKEKISYPRTPKTDRGSFTAGKGGWMRKHPHWLPRTIAAAERYAEAGSKFVEGFVMKYAHRGRLHATINQFRNEEGGTRSHRFSYSDPPLQQMPERDEEIGPLIRSLFLPEQDCVWGAHDYSQQEYRIIVHAGYILKCNRAADAVKMYHDNPKTDFHGLVVEWTGLERRAAKDTNFAKAFGAGVPKFALMIGRTEDEAREIYERYDQDLPFVSEAAKTCQRMAEKRGYIRLIDGARSHFDFWLPLLKKDFKADMNPRRYPDPFISVFGDVPKKRTWVHKAFNRYVQGSAARQTKLAMLQCWREGHVPLLQMHDDLNFSHTQEDEGLRVAEIMRDVVQLSVPMMVDSEYGDSWGTARKSDTHDASWRSAQRLKRQRR